MPDFDDIPPDPFQMLILEKLDTQHEAIKEIKGEVRDLKDDLTEVKINHLAHLSADTAILKDSAERTESWIGRHDQRHHLLDEAHTKGRWKLWAAIAGGMLAVFAAIIGATL